VKQLNELMIAIKGAGEMASAVAWRLYMANLRKIFMLEIAHPMAVRRNVSFCEAVKERQTTVEGVEAVKAENTGIISALWCKDNIAVIVDPQWTSIGEIKPDVVIDATLAKRNLGTNRTEARLVIGLGPGFEAGRDVHFVIETNRGHHLGRVIENGPATANTGIPGSIGGYTKERVLRAPGNGDFLSTRQIGDIVQKGDIVGTVTGIEVSAPIDGVLRGLIRPGSRVSQGLKIGDIDPRGAVEYCDTISEKGRAIAGSVLEAILRVYNSKS
jgi:xanthine dehydrogenase accessory factor